MVNPTTQHFGCIVMFFFTQPYLLICFLQIGKSQCCQPDFVGLTDMICWFLIPIETPLFSDMLTWKLTSKQDSSSQLAKPGGFILLVQCRFVPAESQFKHVITRRAEVFHYSVHWGLWISILYLHRGVCAPCRLIPPPMLVNVSIHWV